MNYPLVSDYIESIMLAEDNFATLTNLRPVLDDAGQPIMSSGNFAVVFKMRDIKEEKDYAVKCFLKDQNDREESYRMISDELETSKSRYFISVKYLANEIFVDSNNCHENEFPVLLMEWVEGRNLYAYVRDNIGNTHCLETLVFDFCQMSSWLLSQPFAHGDIKPDNVVVKTDGSIVLVDYDGMFVPEMRNMKAREQGSPNFRNPFRQSFIFDEHIDDFALVAIALSLKAIVLAPTILFDFCSTDCFMMSVQDYLCLDKSEVYQRVKRLSYETNIKILLETFESVLKNKSEQDSYDCLNIINLEFAKKNDAAHLYNTGFDFYKGETKRENYKLAFMLIEAAHRNGNNSASSLLGTFYEKGIGVCVDRTSALSCFKKAAQSGLTEAYLKLADFYLEENEILVSSKQFSEAYDNKKAAIIWYEKCATNGNPESMLKLGLLLKEQLSYNNDSAIRWFENAADNGISEALYQLGLIRYYGVPSLEHITDLFVYGKSKHPVVTRYLDKEKGVKYLFDACNDGHSKAMCLLGKLYEEGEYFPKNHSMALYYIKLAASKKLPEACAFLGCCYLYGYYDIAKDEKKAYEQLEIASNGGDAMGLLLFAHLTEHGIACEPNTIEASLLYEMGIERIECSWQYKNNDDRLKIGFLNNVELTGWDYKKRIGEAYYRLAVIYENNTQLKTTSKPIDWYYSKAAINEESHACEHIGISKFKSGDYKQAAKYLPLAASFRLTKAMFFLGLLCFKGVCNASGGGVQKPNYTEAFNLFSSAAKENDINAILMLAYCFFCGIGCKKDRNKGFEYLVQCANLECPEAQYLLGFFYSYGIIATKQYSTALFWLKKSLSQGYIHSDVEILKIFVKKNDHINAYSCLCRENYIYKMSLMSFVFTSLYLRMLGVFVPLIVSPQKLIKKHLNESIFNIL